LPDQWIDQSCVDQSEGEREICRKRTGGSVPESARRLALSGEGSTSGCDFSTFRRSTATGHILLRD